MGTNCAIFVATRFCFSYEFEFIEQLVGANTPAALDLLRKFRFTKRFVDDLFSGDNPVFDKYFYQSMTDSDGFKGIYPDFLEPEREQDSTSSVHFLDTEIGFDGSCWFTKIFDKKEHPPLSRISQKRYPHPSCYISDRSKFGIITSRLHCFNRICQKRNDFVERCKIFIREFMSRGYSKTRVRFFCIRFFKSVPTSFPLPRRLKHFVNSLFPV